MIKEKEKKDWNLFGKFNHGNNKALLSLDTANAACTGDNQVKGTSDVCLLHAFNEKSGHLFNNKTTMKH